MFGLRSKLPLSDADRERVDGMLARLEVILGRDRFLQAPVVLPEDRFFPDRFDGSLSSVRAMAARLAGYMGVPREVFTVVLYAEGEDAFREGLPGSQTTRDAAGLYVAADGSQVVGVHARLLKTPEALAAALAHEVAHVLLLGGGLLDRDDPDMEPLTDLATILLGFGVLGSRSAFQFRQWSEGGMQGWSYRRAGYLPEEVWAYALARFAMLRGEQNPAWASLLVGNIAAYFKRSMRVLRQG